MNPLRVREGWNINHAAGGAARQNRQQVIAAHGDATFRGAEVIRRNMKKNCTSRTGDNRIIVVTKGDEHVIAMIGTP